MDRRTAVFILDTLKPYKELDSGGIQYSVCRDYSHISRHRALRQVVHKPLDSDRYMALEVPNPIQSSNIDFVYHNVTPDEENRLDVIAYKCLGSASYSWVISYFNNIEDGFTVRSGQKLKMPRSVTDLMTTGNVLASVPAVQLNLGSE